MGTRADFYVGRGEDAEWIGSIAWNGHPGRIPNYVLHAESQEDFRKGIKRLFGGRNDATLPKDGWPWPWNDSHTTDYAYAFDDGKVWHSTYAGNSIDVWWDASLPYTSDDDATEMDISDLTRCVFPDMSDKKNVVFGKRSGLITNTTT